MDRFAMPDGHTEPKEAGSCEACGGVTYDYELITCPSCESPIHKGCQQPCKGCGLHGCSICLAEIGLMEWMCENCILEELKKEN